MYWNWKIGGIVLGLTFLFAVALKEPIGVSTQFVVLDGMIGRMFHSKLVEKTPHTKSGYSSSNTYLNQSDGKLAKSVAQPFNYGFIFVLCMVLGGLTGRFLTKNKDEKIINQVPICHKERFGDNATLRYVLAFCGGILVLWGARLAGGCTSGHMMSGMMQTALSGYYFALAAFAAAVPVAIFLYKKKIKEAILMNILLAIILGVIFGFILQRIGAADPDKIIGMLRLTDLHLAKTILLAIGISSSILFLGILVGAISSTHLEVKSAHIGVIIGGAILGAGWALSGFCPGTGVVAAGSGRKDGLFFVVGGLVGAGIFTAMYGSMAKSFLFTNIGGTMTLAQTSKYDSLLSSINGVIPSVIIGVALIVIAVVLPQKIR